MTVLEGVALGSAVFVESGEGGEDAGADVVDAFGAAVDGMATAGESEDADPMATTAPAVSVARTTRPTTTAIITPVRALVRASTSPPGRHTALARDLRSEANRIMSIFGKRFTLFRCETGHLRVWTMAKKLVIKVTAGADAPERCSQAFTVAAVAVASGVEVSLWLTGESAWFALPGKAAEFELPHSAPLPDLIEGIMVGGRITLCTQCAARRGITEKDLLEGVRIAGSQVFVSEVMADGAQALVY